MNEETKRTILALLDDNNLVEVARIGLSLGETVEKVRFAKFLVDWASGAEIEDISEIMRSM